LTNIFAKSLKKFIPHNDGDRAPFSGSATCTTMWKMSYPKLTIPIYHQSAHTTPILK